MDDPWPSMRMSSMPGNIFWAIFNEASGDYLNYDGEHDDEPRDGVKMIGSTSQKFFVVVPAGEDHGPDHFRYVESTPGDLPLLKIKLQHHLARETLVRHPVRRRL